MLNVNIQQPSVCFYINNIFRKIDFFHNTEKPPNVFFCKTLVFNALIYGIDLGLLKMLPCHQNTTYGKNT